MQVSIVIPTYKKEKTIVDLLKNIYNEMSENIYDFELIFVEDGKLDKSLENLSDFIKDKPEFKKKVKLYGYKTNKGKGYAVRYGMARASGEYIAFIDDSVEINPKSITVLLEYMVKYNADIVVASKRHPQSKTSLPILRKIYSNGYYFLCKVLFGLTISDTQTGLKVYKRQVLDQVMPRLLVKQYAFDIELLSVANRLGFTKIIESPVEVLIDFKTGSRFRISRPLFLDKFVRDMMWDTLAVFYRLRILRYYDDKSSRLWKYDEELEMRINTGGMGKTKVDTKFPQDEISLSNDFRFSVIIPVRTITTFLEQNIINLKALPFKDFEVIIVIDYIEDYDFKDSRFKLITSGPIGPGEKRNIGAKYAKGEILAFLDDDAYPSANWLTEAANLFDTNNIYSLGAPAITPRGVGFLERCSGRVLESLLTSGIKNHIHLPKKQKYVKDFPTVNFFVKRKEFYKVGGFITEYWPGEDTKLCLDLVTLMGVDILYDSRPIVYHHRRELFTPHLKQYSRYGQHRGQFSRIYPETSRQLFYFLPSMLVLGILSGPVIFYYLPLLVLPYLYTILAYIGLVLFESIRASLNDRNLFEIPFVALGIILTHFVYGIYFIKGIFINPKLQLRYINSTTKSYIGG